MRANSTYNLRNFVLLGHLWEGAVHVNGKSIRLFFGKFFDPSLLTGWGIIDTNSILQ